LLSDSDLRNPHHEYRFHFQFSTYRSVGGPLLSF
jgi:hypothetical protein